MRVCGIPKKFVWCSILYPIFNFSFAVCEVSGSSSGLNAGLCRRGALYDG